MNYLIAVSIMVSFFSTSYLFADEVIMRDRSKVKGLVIEEYVDRITLSTADGEKDIFRKDIERIEYDTPEQNFMQLGRDYDSKGQYDKAAFYYKKAIEINPDYKEARESYIASHSKIWRQEERRTKKELERQKMVMDWRKEKDKEEFAPSRNKTAALKAVLGISLEEKNGIFIITEVEPDSSASRAGIKKGDNLVGIWGTLVRYTKMEEVIDLLLGPKYSEVRVLVEKLVHIPRDADSKNLYKELGISLGFEYEGLMVNDIDTEKKGYRAGLEKEDFVIMVDNITTRYLPLDSIITLISNGKNKRDIVFTVRRTVTLRREGE